MTPSALITARSVFGSVPTISRGHALATLKVTCTVLPCAATTWLLVTMLPSGRARPRRSPHRCRSGSTRRSAAPPAAMGASDERSTTSTEVGAAVGCWARILARSLSTSCTTRPPATPPPGSQRNPSGPGRPPCGPARPSAGAPASASVRAPPWRWPSRTQVCWYWYGGAAPAADRLRRRWSARPPSASVPPPGTLGAGGADRLVPRGSGSRSCTHDAPGAWPDTGPALEVSCESTLAGDRASRQAAGGPGTSRPAGLRVHLDACRRGRRPARPRSPGPGRHRCAGCAVVPPGAASLRVAPCPPGRTARRPAPPARRVSPGPVGHLDHRVRRRRGAAAASTGVPAGVWVSALVTRLPMICRSRASSPLTTSGRSVGLDLHLDRPVRRHGARAATAASSPMTSRSSGTGVAAGAPGRAGPAAAGPRPAGPSGPPRPRSGAAPSAGSARRRPAGTARRSRGWWSAGYAARARRPRRTGASAPRTARARPRTPARPRSSRERRLDLAQHRVQRAGEPAELGARRVPGSSRAPAGVRSPAGDGGGGPLDLAAAAAGSPGPSRRPPGQQDQHSAADEQLDRRPAGRSALSTVDRFFADDAAIAPSGSTGRPASASGLRPFDRPRRVRRAPRRRRSRSSRWPRRGQVVARYSRRSRCGCQRRPRSSWCVRA